MSVPSARDCPVTSKGGRNREEADRRKRADGLIVNDPLMPITAVTRAGIRGTDPRALQDLGKIKIVIVRGQVGKAPARRRIAAGVGAAQAQGQVPGLVADIRQVEVFRGETEVST